uniref:Uncharacterized protein n=1 Tax=Trichogramma kaykai TaxID=54128 RepID=A0ABD2W6B5_9HYME
MESLSMRHLGDFRRPGAPGCRREPGDIIPSFLLWKMKIEVPVTKKPSSMKQTYSPDRYPCVEGQSTVSNISNIEP